MNHSLRFIGFGTPLSDFQCGMRFRLLDPLLLGRVLLLGVPRFKDMAFQAGGWVPLLLLLGDNRCHFSLLGFIDPLFRVQSLLAPVHTTQRPARLPLLPPMPPLPLLIIQDLHGELLYQEIKQCLIPSSLLFGRTSGRSRFP